MKLVCQGNTDLPKSSHRLRSFSFKNLFYHTDSHLPHDAGSNHFDFTHTHKYKIKMIYVFILPVKQRPTMEFNACQTKQQHVSIHPQMKIFKQDHLDPQHIGIPLSRGRLRSFAPLSSKLGCDGWTKFRRQLKSLTGWSLKLYFGGTHLYFGGTSLCVSSSSTCFPAIKTRRSPQLWRPTCLFESIIPALVG